MMLRKRRNFPLPQGLGEEITDHLVCWTVINGDVLALGHVRDEEIYDIHVAGALAAGRPPI